MAILDLKNGPHTLLKWSLFGRLQKCTLWTSKNGPYTLQKCTFITSETDLIHFKMALIDLKKVSFRPQNILFTLFKYSENFMAIIEM